MTIQIGIIGGSGLDNPELFLNPKDQILDTKWGAPSSPLKLGEIAGINVALLARHGREHTIPPTQVNYRANIQAFKDIGCTHILASIDLPLVALVPLVARIRAITLTY
jgi:5'-methylthioadenosine phosphorylase